MDGLARTGSHGELTSLDLVIRETVNTLESEREQLFAVSENARNECSRLEGALLETDRQLEEISKELAEVESSEKEAQNVVAKITGNFERHTEAEIKGAYERAKELQVKSTLLKERYEQLEHKKKELQTSLHGLRETAEKAEGMVSRVGVVMDFIRGNLKDLNVKLETLHQRQQMGLQVIRAQEEERKRVAREIHDGPAQSMANVVLRMEFCEKLMEVDPHKVRAELQELKGIVKNTLQDIRKIIFDLRPMALDDLGVVPALKRYIEDFRQKYDINIEMSFYGRETRLEPALEVALFRLVQEALNNVLKHSNASNAKVIIEMKPEWVKAIVEDDGTGFDLEQALANQGGTKFGLISMKERISLLEGDIDIDTRPGRGTKILFKVPVTR